MVLPRRIRPLTIEQLQQLTVERLLAYRKKALSLEDSLAASDYIDTEIAQTFDETYIWFKEDSRWKPLYDAIISELTEKQAQ
ncbi:MAG: hypothetical protein ACRC2R_19620 [Xenococcaceae cyanobacterium]